MEDECRDRCGGKRTTKGSWSSSFPLSEVICDGLEREVEADDAVFGTSSGCERVPMTIGLDLGETGGAPSEHVAIAGGSF